MLQLIEQNYRGVGEAEIIRPIVLVLFVRACVCVWVVFVDCFCWGCAERTAAKTERTNDAKTDPKP